MFEDATVPVDGWDKASVEVDLRLIVDELFCEGEVGERVFDVACAFVFVDRCELRFVVDVGHLFGEFIDGDSAGTGDVHDFAVDVGRAAHGEEVCVYGVIYEGEVA